MFNEDNTVEQMLIEAATKYKVGDVNKDGVISINDVTPLFFNEP